MGDLSVGLADVQADHASRSLLEMEQGFASQTAADIQHVLALQADVGLKFGVGTLCLIELPLEVRPSSGFSCRQLAEGAIRPMEQPVQKENQLLL